MSLHLSFTIKFFLSTYHNYFQLICGMIKKKKLNECNFSIMNICLMSLLEFPHAPPSGENYLVEEESKKQKFKRETVVQAFIGFVS